MFQAAISKLIEKHGYKPLAEVCGVSYPAIYKWRKNGSLPRTEWTGETRYAELIAEFDPEFSKEELLTRTRNKHETA